MPNPQELHGALRQVLIMLFASTFAAGMVGVVVTMFIDEGDTTWPAVTIIGSALFFGLIGLFFIVTTIGSVGRQGRSAPGIDPGGPSPVTSTIQEPYAAPSGFSSTTHQPAPLDGLISRLKTLALVAGVVALGLTAYWLVTESSEILVSLLVLGFVSLQVPMMLWMVGHMLTLRQNNIMGIASEGSQNS